MEARIEEVEGGEVNERQEVDSVRVKSRCLRDNGTSSVQRSFRERLQRGEEPRERGSVEIKGVLVNIEWKCQRVEIRYPFF